ncbi:ferredoxin [Litchfieldella qijiaojingensis]|uniref:Ferredoxin n=1 Tax=Litchfieldella qijiaojingensis TaxID=980347 RepID=A0ABQ2YZ58_9GAMM|nr:ferredoxin [Halomonas qijiaojingensis]GGX98645.1 ferredoxin [Halomonas qijiaojingensis]
MKICVDRGKCQDHGQCIIAAPDIFRFDEDGTLQYEPHVDESLREAAEEASDVCPEQAITIVDE